MNIEELNQISLCLINGIVIFINRYFVGVLDKGTMQMKVHNAQLFNMLPVIPGKYGICNIYSGLFVVMEISETLKMVVSLVLKSH